MRAMSRGLLIRFIIMTMGSIPLTIVLHLIDPPVNLGGVAILVYVAAISIALADYGVKHPEESPGRSKRG
jgi:hypothetical protein